MANLNKVHLIGRLTKDVEIQTFANGGKIAKMGFAVNNSKKDQATGKWISEPVWLDLEAFNRGENGKLADTCAQYLHKGSQAYIEGHLKLDEWTTNDGQKRSKLKIVVDTMQMLDGKPQEGGGERMPAAENQAQGEQTATTPAGDVPF